MVRDTVWSLVDGDGEVPGWWVRGRMVLIPKDGSTGRPEQYRPITCLNNGYKCMTGALTTILTRHIELAVIMPREQKALQKGQRGCLDAL